jgi:hypothetical protein
LALVSGALARLKSTMPDGRVIYGDADAGAVTVKTKPDTSKGVSAATPKGPRR